MSAESVAAVDDSPDPSMPGDTTATNKILFMILTRAAHQNGQDQHRDWPVVW